MLEISKKPAAFATVLVAGALLTGCAQSFQSQGASYHHDQSYGAAYGGGAYAGYDPYGQSGFEAMAYQDGFIDPYANAGYASSQGGYYAGSTVSARYGSEAVAGAEAYSYSSSYAGSGRYGSDAAVAGYEICCETPYTYGPQIIEVPVEVEKIVTKEVPVEKIVEKVIEKPVYIKKSVYHYPDPVIPPKKHRPRKK